MICLQTPSFGWSFQDGRQLASMSVHPKQRDARSSPIFHISVTKEQTVRVYLNTGFCFWEKFIIFPSSSYTSKHQKSIHDQFYYSQGTLSLTKPLRLWLNKSNKSLPNNANYISSSIMVLQTNTITCREIEQCTCIKFNSVIKLPQ